MVKTSLVTELEQLFAALNETDETKLIDTAEELYPELARIIVAVDGFVEDHNTYKRIYETIRASEIETVQLFAIGIGLNDMTTIFDKLIPLFENEEENNETTLLAVNTFATEIKTRFALLDEKAEDALVLAVSQFIVDAEGVAALDATTYTYAKVFTQLDRIFSDNLLPFGVALTQQTDNRKVVSDAIEKLITIFNLPADWIPDWGGKSLAGLDGYTNVEPEEPTLPGDGIIVDGIQYPSNEKVYDYYTKVICEYGKVFEGDAHNYKAAINMLIAQGVEDGTIDPETEEMLRKYLDKLSGSPANGDA